MLNDILEEKHSPIQRVPALALWEDIVLQGRGPIVRIDHVAGRAVHAGDPLGELPFLGGEGGMVSMLLFSSFSLFVFCQAYTSGGSLLSLSLSSGIRGDDVSFFFFVWVCIPTWGGARSLAHRELGMVAERNAKRICLGARMIDSSHTTPRSLSLRAYDHMYMQGGRASV